MMDVKLYHIKDGVYQTDWFMPDEDTIELRIEGRVERLDNLEREMAALEDRVNRLEPRPRELGTRHRCGNMPQDASITHAQHPVFGAGWYFKYSCNDIEPRVYYCPYCGKRLQKPRGVE